MVNVAETNLNILIKNMEPILQDGVYVFTSSKISFADTLNLEPIMVFQEAEGTTLILNKKIADQENIGYIYESRMITLNVHSSLNAIGFLAQITKKLSDNGISVNPVSAYFHDHLFVPKDKANLAMKILNELTGK